MIMLSLNLLNIMVVDAPKTIAAKIIVNATGQELVVESIVNAQIVRTQEVGNKEEGRQKDELKLVFEELLIIFFPYFELNHAI